MVHNTKIGKEHNPLRQRTDVRKDLRTIFVEGVAFSVMVGIGETYLPAFVLALGMGEVASGLIATVPLVAGGVLQLITPLGVRWVGSYRRWAVLCAALQALVFAPLVVGAAVGRIPGFVVFLLATLYWASGMAIGPAWNIWVEQLIPPAVRTRYFARRTSATNLGVLSGLLAGGLILDRMQTGTHPLFNFTLLFAIAGVARLTSANLLRTQNEPNIPSMPYRPREVFGVIRHFHDSAGGELLTYMLALTVAVTFASPFFTAFMLRQLELSYAAYTSLLVIALAAKAVALPLFGRLARRLGLAWLLRAAWVGIVVVPALWLVSDSLAYLAGLQILAGAAWAAHEYVTFLLLFEVIGPRERGTLLIAYNLGNALASTGGSLLGGFVFDALGGGMTSYSVLFGTSSIARASCLVFLVRVTGARVPTIPVAFRTIAVRPSMGVVIRPILATLRFQRGRKAHTEPTSRNRDRAE
jgi:MFS family permease